MPVEKVNKKRLVQWIKDYTKSCPDKETMNVVFHLNDIEEFIGKIKYYNDQTDPGNVVTGVRFYLVRQNDSNRELIRDGDTQICLVGTAVINYQEFSGYNGVGGGPDLAEGNDYLCIYPLGLDSEHTGLCPQHCGGSLNGIDGTT